MPDDYVTRHEFNGLGGRVTEMDKAFVAFQASQTAELQAMKSDITETKNNVTLLFNGQKEVNDNVNSLKVQIAGLVVKIALTVGGILAVIRGIELLVAKVV